MTAQQRRRARLAAFVLTGALSATSLQTYRYLVREGVEPQQARRVVDSLDAADAVQVTLFVPTARVAATRATIATRYCAALDLSDVFAPGADPGPVDAGHAPDGGPLLDAGPQEPGTVAARTAECETRVAAATLMRKLCRVSDGAEWGRAMRGAMLAAHWAQLDAALPVQVKRRTDTDVVMDPVLLNDNGLRGCE